MSLYGHGIFPESENQPFTGASSSTAGTAGLVPAPQAGDQVNFLRGDGTFAAVSAGSGYQTVENAGTAVAQQTTINFTTTAITAVNNAGANRTDVSLASGITGWSGFNTNGILTQTANNTYTARTLTGTASRLTITNGDGIAGAPTFDISSSYVGQNTITTLGTVTTGTWNASVVGSTYGGTGVNNGTSTITLGGNFTTSGAFATTLTTTGATNVTLPTSGTLATTAQLPTLASLGGLSTSGGTMSGNVDFANNELIRPQMINYSETAPNVTAASTTTLDVSTGNTFNLAQAVDITTLTLTTAIATGSSCSFTLIRTKDATATARAITWPASVKWGGGTAPTLTQTTGAVDILEFFTINGGTTWYGFASGLNVH